MDKESITIAISKLEELTKDNADKNTIVIGDGLGGRAGFTRVAAAYLELIARETGYNFEIIRRNTAITSGNLGERSIGYLEEICEEVMDIGRSYLNQP